MRKLTLIILSVLFFSFNTYAQLPISLGVKIGFNSSKMTNELKNVSDITNETKTGFLFGAFARINLPIIYVQPELYFTKKGGNFKSASMAAFPNQLFTQQTVLNTFDVPVLLGVKLINLKVVNLRLMMGPVLSIVTGKDVTYQVNGTNYVNTPSTGQYKNTMWGIQAGAGIDVLNFTLDVRYEWGLSNISDNADMNTKTRLLNVSLGLKFF